MIRISPVRPPLSTENGLEVYIEGISPIVMESPSAQRMVMAFVQSDDRYKTQTYGLSKFAMDAVAEGADFPYKGHWKLLASQFPKASVRV